MNIKTIYKCMTATILLGSIVLPSVLHAEVMGEQTSAQQEVKNKAQYSRFGLMGYYYNDSNFSQLAMMVQEKSGDLKVTKKETDDLLENDKQNIKSVRWIGYIQPSKSEEYMFSTSSDSHVIMQIDGKSVINQSPMKDKIKLEKDKLYEIKVEYRPSDQEYKYNLANLQLYWTSMNSDKEIIPEQNLLLPEFSPNKNKTKLIPETHLFDNPINSSFEYEFYDKNGSSAPNVEYNIEADDKADKNVDTDDDSITDYWETHGYTIKNQKYVPWTDDLATKGYIKYTSNPFTAYTVGDPYTDFEKAAGHVPATISKEAHNPLVAAFPAVGVKLEKLIISENNDYTNSEEHSMNSSQTTGTTIGAEVNLNASALYGLSGGVTTSFSHSNTTENTISQSTGKVLHLNEAEAAYVNLNVRYYNSGTAPIMMVAPTTNFALGSETIGSFTAQANQIGNNLDPGETYPSKELHALSLNTMDQFNSQPIKINRLQLEKLRSGAPVSLETSQVAGKYAKINTSGDIEVAGDWSTHLSQIQNKTADLIIDTGEIVKEEKIAAKDYSNPEDKTPELTIKEAIKLAFGAKEENGRLIYNGKNINEHFVELFYDKDTEKEMIKQLEKKKEMGIYDVKITPKMKILIKTPILFADGTRNEIDWKDTNFNGPGVEGTGYNTSNIGLGHLKYPLESNTSYILGGYFKGTRHGQKVNFGIGTGTGDYPNSQRIILSESGSWKRFEMKFTTGDDVSKFNTIQIKNHIKDPIHAVYFDNISITKLGKAEKEFDGITEDYIQEAHSFKSTTKSSMAGAEYIDNIYLNVKKPIEWKYKVVVDGKEIGNPRITDEPDSNGDMGINFLDFNGGQGIPAQKHIEVYVVKEGMNPVKVAENQKYNLELKIKFKNDGESGEIEPYGDITFMNNNESFEIWNDSNDNSDREYVQGKPYKYDIQFRSFSSINEETNIRFIANIKEEDYGANQDDTIAFGADDPKDIKGLKGNLTFTGDEPNEDSVNIEYEITKRDN